MLQSFSGPVPRLAVIVPLGLALAVLPLHAQVAAGRGASSSAVQDGSKRLPLSSLSGLTRYIEALKAERAAKASAAERKDAEREGREGWRAHVARKPEAKSARANTPRAREEKEDGAGWLDAYQ